MANLTNGVGKMNDLLIIIFWVGVVLMALSLYR